MDIALEIEREKDGTRLAEPSQRLGALAYGAFSDEARVKAETLALRVIAEKLEHGEALPLRIVGRPSS